MQQKTYAWTNKGGEKFKARGETVTCSRKGCDEKFPEEIKIGRWETIQFCSKECKDRHLESYENFHFRIQTRNTVRR